MYTHKSSISRMTAQEFCARDSREYVSKPGHLKNVDLLRKPTFYHEQILQNKQY